MLGRLPGDIDAEILSGLSALIRQPTRCGFLYLPKV
jgi:hypothetical protein